MPRVLSGTQQGWTSVGGGLLQYNTPEMTGRMLDADQGKFFGYRDTCGVVSCVNVAILAGVNATEEKALQVAVHSGFCTRKLSLGSLVIRQGGGTAPEQRRAILHKMGIVSSMEEATVRNIAQRVSEGRGVIISVRADRLWQSSQAKGLHAVTVTSVLVDSRGNVHGFYICDSGLRGTGACRFYTVQEIQNALTPGRKMNVTSTIIR